MNAGTQYFEIRNQRRQHFLLSIYARDEKVQC